MDGVGDSSSSVVVVSTEVADVPLYHQNPHIYQKISFYELTNVATSMHERFKTV